LTVLIKCYIGTEIGKSKVDGFHHRKLSIGPIEVTI
jgi:hypothetical protein